MAKVIWNDMKDAPRDGSWIVIKVEVDNALDGGVRVARWNPRLFPDISGHKYHWEVINTYESSNPEDAPDFINWWVEEGVLGWHPMPELKTANNHGR